MVSRAALLLRATPMLFSFRNSAYPKTPVQIKRFYTAKSILEPPNVARLAETARISLTPQQVEEFGPKISQVIDCNTEGDNLRDDEPEIFDNRDAIIAAVPIYEDPYIKVPKVLNKE
ncbi:hypothetical protein CASFOL_022268 [Castilleja foliolosa]|uniref:Glu-AdT subunit C n=1 Tax=Castilleja foliolosa TaxID=1961234 RepID=A0ABD3CXH4_9LAMI